MSGKFSALSASFSTCDMNALEVDHLLSPLPSSDSLLFYQREQYLLWGLQITGENASDFFPSLTPELDEALVSEPLLISVAFLVVPSSPKLCWKASHFPGDQLVAFPGLCFKECSQLTLETQMSGGRSCGQGSRLLPEKDNTHTESAKMNSLASLVFVK